MEIQQMSQNIKNAPSKRKTCNIFQSDGGTTKKWVCIILKLK